MEPPIKTTLRAVPFLFFLLTVFFSGSVRAKEYRLEILEKEALKFAQSYTAKSNLPPKPQKADLLRRAADIMAAERQCTVAIPLYRQAALFSGEPDADLWLAVARANSCAKQWAKASQSSWLAYRAADNDKLRTAAALSLIGGASYGTTYEITLRKGLKGKNRELMDTAAFTIATGHSPSALLV